MDPFTQTHRYILIVEVRVNAMDPFHPNPKLLSVEVRVNAQIYSPLHPIVT